jgi:hypothetical protein
MKKQHIPFSLSLERCVKIVLIKSLIKSQIADDEEISILDLIFTTESSNISAVNPNVVLGDISKGHLIISFDFNLKNKVSTTADSSYKLDEQQSIKSAVIVCMKTHSLVIPVTAHYTTTTTESPRLSENPLLPGFYVGFQGCRTTKIDNNHVKNQKIYSKII